jgi:hypothetical protein
MMRILKYKNIIIELILKSRILISILILGEDFSLNLGKETNEILDNQLINKIQSFINNMDNQTLLIVISISIIILCFAYIIYIFSFIVTPLLFDAIKDFLPIKIKDYLIKLIKINRKISVPFVILSFVMLVIGLFFAVSFLSLVVYLRYLKYF